MSFLGGNPEARADFIKSLGNIAQPQLSPGQVAGSIDDFFQRGPITASQLSDALGTPEEFMERYKAWDIKYQKALEAEANVGKGNRVMSQLRARLGRRDLNQLSRETSQSLHDDFLRSVLRLDTVIQNTGAPGMQLPSENLYRHSFMASVDAKEALTHPGQMAYNSLIFNVNPERSDLSAINIGRNIKGYDLFASEWENAKNFGNVPFGNMPTTGKKILTLDIESTGLHSGAQVRSLSVAEMVLDKNGQFLRDAQNQIGTPKTIFNMGFESPQLNGLTVFDMNSGTSTMNDFLMKNEGFGKGNFKQMGDEFLDSSSDLIEKILTADTLAGHNIAYDLDMVTQTMMAQEGFTKHKRAGALVGQLYDKISSGDFVVDTANSARAYMQREGQIAVDAFEEEYNRAVGAIRGAMTSVEKNQAKVQLMLAPENIARGALLERSGRASYTYASVGNIILNTNLAELIEQESPEAAQSLFEMIKQGTHIAETDTHLQSYIGKYIQDSKLKLRANYLREGGVFSEFGEFVRSRTAKSSAVTSTTNIASVRQMSDQVFKYVTGEGITGVQMRASIGELADSGVLDLAEMSSRINPVTQAAMGASNQAIRDMHGTIAFSEGKFVFAPADIAGETQILDSTLASRFLRERLTQARTIESEIISGSNSYNESMLVAGKKVALAKNLIDDSIYDLGVSFGSASAADSLSKLSDITINESPNLTNINRAIGSTYEDFGAGLSEGEQLKGVWSRGSGSSTFKRGFKKFGDTEIVSMGQKFADAGDPYARLLDPQSRRFSTAISSATADVARQAADATMVSNGAADARHLASFAHQELVSEMTGGVFRAQREMRLVDMAGTAAPVRSKVMVQPEIVKHILRNVDDEGGAVSAGAKRLQNLQMSVGLSNVKVGNKNMLNAAWQIGEQAGRQGSDEFARRLVDLMTHDVDGQTAEAKMATALKVDINALPADVKSNIARINMMEGGERTGFIEQLSRSIYDKGVVIGNLEENASNKALNMIGDMFETVDNDSRSSQRAFVSHSQLGDDAVVLDPWYNREAIQVAGLGEELDQARSLVDLGDGTKVSRSIHAANNIINTAAEGEGGLEKLASSMSSKKIGIGENKLLTFYNANKSHLKTAGLAVAAAGLAYMVAKKHRTNSLYEETMAQQPREKGRGVDTMNDSARGVTQRDPIMSDPLATAGVVGNLDRYKMGRTRMGNNRNDHLFGS